MAGTATKVDVAVVARLRVGPIAETIPLTCAAASEFVAVANVQLGTADESTHQILSYGLLLLTFYHFLYTAGSPTSTTPT